MSEKTKRVAKGVYQTKNGRYQAFDSKWYVGTYDSLTEAVIARDRAKAKRAKPKVERVCIPLDGFQDRLNEAIWKSDLDITEIAERTGINKTSIYNYRYYGKQPRVGALARLAVVLNVSSDWLLGIG